MSAHSGLAVKQTQGVGLHLPEHLLCAIAVLGTRDTAVSRVPALVGLLQLCLLQM